MGRIDDRIAFPRIRRMSDRAFGDLILDTLVVRLPELRWVRAGHFSDALAPEEKRRLFRLSVRFIEIETHSYCNRTCWFCPNSRIDRRSVRHYLPEATYLRILDDLRSIDYHAQLSFSRYNEPFGDEVVFDRIKQARLALPHCTLLAFSNGDFVTASVLKSARKAGLSELHLGCYPQNGQPWSPECAEFEIASRAKRLGLDLKRRRENPGSRILYESRYDDMRVTVYCPNYEVGGTDRGGVIAGVPARPEVRKSPCLSPTYKVVIDYTASVMPCCQLRSDVDGHGEFAFGLVDDTPGAIFSAYTSASAARWRRAVISFGDKPAPCRGCLFHEWSDCQATRLLHRLALGCVVRR